MLIAFTLIKNLTRTQAFKIWISILTTRRFRDFWGTEEPIKSWIVRVWDINDTGTVIVISQIHYITTISHVFRIKIIDFHILLAYVACIKFSSRSNLLRLVRYSLFKTIDHVSNIFLKNIRISWISETIRRSVGSTSIKSIWVLNSRESVRIRVGSTCLSSIQGLVGCSTIRNSVDGVIIKSIRSVVNIWRSSWKVGSVSSKVSSCASLVLSNESI